MHHRDADSDIVRAAVEPSYCHSTTVIGKDTDLLVLFLYYAKTDSKACISKDRQSKAIKVYDINRLKLLLGKELCFSLLFIHAFTGCDKTSHIFGVGKKLAFQNLVKGDSVIQSCAKAFVLPSQTSDITVDLSSQVIAIMLSGKCNDTLATLHYNLLSTKILSAKSCLIPERLPLLHHPPNSIASEFTTRS